MAPKTEIRKRVGDEQLWPASKSRKALHKQGIDLGLRQPKKEGVNIGEIEHHTNKAETTNIGGLSEEQLIKIRARAQSKAAVPRSSGPCAPYNVIGSQAHIKPQKPTPLEQ